MNKPREYTNINAEQKREHKRRLSELYEKHLGLCKWLSRNPSSHPDWGKKVQDFHAVGVKIEAMEQK